MSSNPCNYMNYGDEDIKRQTGCVRLVGNRSACGRSYLLPIGTIGPAPNFLSFVPPRFASLGVPLNARELTLFYTSPANFWLGPRLCHT